MAGQKMRPRSINEWVSSEIRSNFQRLLRALKINNGFQELIECIHTLCVCVCCGSKFCIRKVMVCSSCDYIALSCKLHLSEIFRNALKKLHINIYIFHSRQMLIEKFGFRAYFHAWCNVIGSIWNLVLHDFANICTIYKVAKLKWNLV